MQANFFHEKYANLSVQIVKIKSNEQTIILALYR